MQLTNEIEAAYRRNCTMLWNLCYPYFMNPADTEDAVQETFVRLLRAKRSFKDAEHEKAWLIMTAKNVCRDELKRKRRTDVPLLQAETLHSLQTEEDATLQAIGTLPEKYRTVIYLYYYEGCRTASIAKLLHRPDATVRSDLRRGRALLKTQLQEDMK